MPKMQAFSWRWMSTQ